MAATFKEDLRASAAVLRAQRALPALSLLVFVGPQALESIARLMRDSCATVCPGLDVLYALASVASFALSIVFLGWVGVERLWFLRAYRELPMPRQRLMHFNVRYFRRFVALALMWLWPLYLAVWLFWREYSFETTIWIVTAIVLVLDAALTFVTPALAYSTFQASVASVEGLRMIKRHWPGGAPYVLVPPMAVLMLGRFSAAGPIGSLVVSAVGVLLSLWLKGAIARFYLREHPEVGEWGSAEQERGNAGAPPA